MLRKRPATDMACLAPDVRGLAVSEMADVNNSTTTLGDAAKQHDKDCDRRGVVVDPDEKLMPLHVSSAIFDFRDALIDLKAMPTQLPSLSPSGMRAAFERAVKTLRDVWVDDDVRPYLSHEQAASAWECGDPERPLLGVLDHAMLECTSHEMRGMPSVRYLRALCDEVVHNVDMEIVGGVDALTREQGRANRYGIVIRLRRYDDGNIGL